MATEGKITFQWHGAAHHHIFYKNLRILIDPLYTRLPGDKPHLNAKREDLGGSYSNYAVVRHTEREFAVDFVFNLENIPLLVSRIIMSPYQVKALHVALGKNIDTFENKFGNIEED